MDLIQQQKINFKITDRLSAENLQILRKRSTILKNPLNKIKQMNYYNLNSRRQRLHVINGINTNLKKYKILNVKAVVRRNGKIHYLINLRLVLIIK